MDYIPQFESQRDENAPVPWTNCNPASQAMLVDLWTWGKENTSDIAIRRASPVPLTEGMNFAAIRLALLKLLPALGELRYSEQEGASNAPMTWGQLLAHLRDGGGAVVCGWYNNVAGNDRSTGWGHSKGWGDWKELKNGLLIRRWQPSGTFGHAQFACDADDDTVLIMDPMGNGDYKGDRIPIAALWDFIWKSGWDSEKVRVTAAHSFASPRPAPPPTDTREGRLRREVLGSRAADPLVHATWQGATRLKPGVTTITAEDRLAAEAILGRMSAALDKAGLSELDIVNVIRRPRS